MSVNLSSSWPKARKKHPPESLKENASLRQRMRSRRLSLGWSADQLAGHLGITPPTISKLETDKRFPRPGLQKRIELWLEEGAL